MRLRAPVGPMLSVLAVLLVPLAALATPSLPPFEFSEIEKYLLIGNGPVNDGTPTINGRPSPGVGDAQDTDNYELGAIKAPVPSTDDFLDGGSSGGPTLKGAVPDIPFDQISPVPQGVTGDGNIAITHPDGQFTLSDVGVYADPNIGIQCAGSFADCTENESQNSFFNDPNLFPNTYVPGADPTQGTGTFVGPGDADPSTSIGSDWGPGGAGVTGDVDFTVLLDQLSDVRQVIPGLTATDSIFLSDGKIGPGTFPMDTIMVVSGLNVIDIGTNGNDLLVENTNWIIDGPSDAYVIFRIDSDANMLISNSNILAGDMIGLNNILFYSTRPDDEGGTHFSFQNTVINGVAFWSLGANGSIDIDNAQGCTQLIADKIDLNDVRFARCAFQPVPEPSAALAFAVGLLVVGAATRVPRPRA